ncbi:MAG: formate dehydrogenase subunit delta [Rhizobiales bacterium]|nr:formate dehydrogenase subunit delta [Hyphomicrobiales bacterium]
MHSPNDALVRMANDIGKFFRSQGEERAIAGIANHIKLFWEPRMKKQIFAHLDEGGAGLDPLSLKGLQKLKADMHGKSTMADAEAAAALAQMAQDGPDFLAEDVAGTSKSNARAYQPAPPQTAKASGSGKRSKH